MHEICIDTKPWTFFILMVFNVSNIKIENLHDQCIESFLQMCLKFDFMAAVEVIYMVWSLEIPKFYMKKVKSNLDVEYNDNKNRHSYCSVLYICICESLIWYPIYQIIENEDFVIFMANAQKNYTLLLFLSVQKST